MIVTSTPVNVDPPKALPSIAKSKTFALKYELILESPLSHEFITQQGFKLSTTRSL